MANDLSAIMPKISASTIPPEDGKDADVDYHRLLNSLRYGETTSLWETRAFFVLRENSAEKLEQATKKYHACKFCGRDVSKGGYFVYSNKELIYFCTHPDCFNHAIRYMYRDLKNKREGESHEQSDR